MASSRPTDSPAASADEVGDIYRDEICYRCGVCCGSADGHPCEHLRREGDKYFCAIYSHRLGCHRTVTGLLFRCVSIRELIENAGGYDCCAYTQALAARRGRANIAE